jgi:hypothetical protein
MGQKTDARIFRQGINRKNWELKHIEKNNEESSLFLYKTLEVQKYLDRFFKLYKIRIHNCKIFYSDTSLRIFISFYISTRTFHTLTKNISKYSKTSLLLLQPTLQKKIKRKNLRFKPLNLKKTKKIKNLQKMRRKKNIALSNLKVNTAINLVGFQEILLKSLETYTKNKTNIFITLHNLNCHKQLSHVQIGNLRQVFKQLRHFVKNSFFKEAMNILFISFSKRRSAKILADFISNQFRLNQLKTDQMTISRKDNYFLGFLKQAILLLVKSEISCLTGIKIVIKGRFNRAPRAKTSGMHFGKISLQSFSSKVDYYQSTAYTGNGTFGIKVWLCENS